MSDVYKAKDHKLNRNVAIKVLKSEYSKDKNFVSKFRVEAQSAASLIHPNIVNAVSYTHLLTITASKQQADKIMKNSMKKKLLTENL